MRMSMTGATALLRLRSACLYQFSYLGQQGIAQLMEFAQPRQCLPAVALGSQRQQFIRQRMHPLMQQADCLKDGLRTEV